MGRFRSIGTTLATSAAVALLLSSAFVAADGVDSDGDGVLDSTELETQRNVVTAVSGDEMNISSRLVSAPDQDRFQISYQAGKFEMQYEGPSGGMSGYELELRNLFEWADTNGNGRIDGDEVLESQSLGSNAFGDVPVLHRETSTADGGRVFNFTIPSREGRVTLALSASERFRRIAGDRVLSPMEVTMEVMISHTFVHPGANLGVDMRVEADGRFAIHDMAWDELHGVPVDRGTMNVTTGPEDRPATSFLSWAKTALADGEGIPVTVSDQVGDGSEHSLYFGFRAGGPPAPSSMTIVHDLTFGVESTLFREILQRPITPRGDILLYTVSLGGIAAFLVATVVMSRRLRPRRGVGERNP